MHLECCSGRGKASVTLTATCTCIKYQLSCTHVQYWIQACRGYYLRSTTFTVVGTPSGHTPLTRRHRSQPRYPGSHSHSAHVTALKDIIQLYQSPTSLSFHGAKPAALSSLAVYPPSLSSLAVIPASFSSAAVAPAVRKSSPVKAAEMRSSAV